jgi:hypothetical protein
MGVVIVDFESAGSKCIYSRAFPSRIRKRFLQEFHMAKRRVTVPLLFAGLMALTGCAQKYTRHMSETYKENKIGAVTIGVVTLPELTYVPPSSCFGSGGSGNGPKYREEWNESLIKTLKESFPKQKFVAVPLGRLEELGIEPASFFSLADANLEKLGVHQYEAQGGELQPIDYQPSRSDGKMKIWLNKLKEKDSIDFVIALVDPRMTGETHTSYNAGPGGGTSSYTVYTSDARFGVWSAETGEIAYGAGAIAASSGFCFFVSPQSASIDGHSSDLRDQLKELITAFLRTLPDGGVRLGRASAAR